MPIWIKQIIKNKKIRISIASFLLFSCFFILAYKSSFNGPWERDEGEYAYSAWLLDEGKLPYENSFLQKPPMIIYTYWMAHRINPDAFWPPRLLAAIFTFLTILLAGKIARKEYGERAGKFAIWILIPMFTLPYLTPFAANVERFMLLPLLGVLALYLNQREKNNEWPFFWAGFLGMAAFLYKPVVALVLAFIIFVWFAENYFRVKNIKTVLYDFFLFLLGFISAAIIFLGYFIIKDGGKGLWEAAFIYNKYYAAQMGKYIPGSFFKYISILFSNWWILFVYTLIFFFIRPKRWWFYSGIVLFCLVSVFSSPIGHYYLMLMPFWAIVISSIVDRICKAIIIDKKEASPVFLNVLIAITLILMFWKMEQQFSLGPQEQSIWIYGNRNPFVESSLVAEKVKEITKDSDKIFVAGSEPQIYYHSKRLSMSRFVITYPLIIDSPVREKYQREVIAEFEKELPKAIVYSNREESGLSNDESPRIFVDYLDRLIEDKYYVVGGYFWEDDFNGYWEKLNNDSNKSDQASLLLYKLKEG